MGVAKSSGGLTGKCSGACWVRSCLFRLCFKIVSWSVYVFEISHHKYNSSIAEELVLISLYQAINDLVAQPINNTFNFNRESKDTIIYSKVKRSNMLEEYQIFGKTQDQNPNYIKRKIKDSSYASDLALDQTKNKNKLNI